MSDQKHGWVIFGVEDGTADIAEVTVEEGTVEKPGDYFWGAREDGAPCAPFIVTFEQLFSSREAAIKQWLSKCREKRSRLEAEIHRWAKEVRNV